MPERSLPETRIAAVVVTRNRLGLLQECIAALRAQTRAIDQIFVVNNASDDGTREWLDAQSDLTPIHQGNMGGAGGFHRGLKTGYGVGHDWFWLMDDDTIPHSDALEKLCAAPTFEDRSAGFLSSIVRWTDGNLHKMNMVGEHAAQGTGWYDTVLRDKCVPAQVSTFVSILVSRRAVALVGLPIKEFFIWADDIEFTSRVSREMPCFLVLDSVVIHKTPANKDGDPSQISPGDVWKLRYGLRNQVAFLRHQPGLSLRPLRVAYFMARQVYFILKGRLPLGVTLGLLRRLAAGLWFNPPIEHVSAEHVSAEHVSAEHVSAEHVSAEHVSAEHGVAKLVAPDTL